MRSTIGVGSISLLGVEGGGADFGSSLLLQKRTKSSAMDWAALGALFEVTLSVKKVSLVSLADMCWTAKVKAVIDELSLVNSEKGKIANFVSLDSGLM